MICPEKVRILELKGVGTPNFFLALDGVSGNESDGCTMSHSSSGIRNGADRKANPPTQRRVLLEVFAWRLPLRM